MITSYKNNSKRNRDLKNNTNIKYSVHPSILANQILLSKKENLLLNKHDINKEKSSLNYKYKINRVSVTQFNKIIENKINISHETQTTLNENINTLLESNNNKDFNDIFSVGVYFDLFEKTNRLKMLESILNRIKIIDLIVAVIAIISIILSVLDYELIYMNGNCAALYDSMNSTNSSSINNSSSDSDVSNNNLTDYYNEIYSNSISNSTEYVNSTAANKSSTDYSSFDLSVYTLDTYAFRYLISGLVIIMYIFNLISIYLINEFQIETLFVMRNSYWYYNQLGRLILETLLIIPHPLPVGIVTIKINNLGNDRPYTIDSFLYGLHLFKVYFYTKFIIENSKYNSLLTHDICYKYACKPKLMFITKCLVKSDGFKLLFYSLMHTILILSYFLRMYDSLESEIFEICEDHSHNYFNNLSNSIFMIIESITTVGYGEYAVQTHIGRFFTLVAVFIGQFIISLMIIWVMNVAEFDPMEKRSFILLKRLMYKQKKKKISGEILAVYFKYTTLKRKMLKIYQNKLKEKAEKGLMINYSEETNKIKDTNNNKNISKINEIKINKNISSNSISNFSNNSSKMSYNDPELQKIYENQKLFYLNKKKESLLEDLDKINLILEKETFNYKEDAFIELHDFIEKKFISVFSIMKNLNSYSSHIQKAILNQKKLMTKLDNMLLLIKSMKENSKKNDMKLNSSLYEVYNENSDHFDNDDDDENSICIKNNFENNKRTGENNINEINDKDNDENEDKEIMKIKNNNNHYNTCKINNYSDSDYENQSTIIKRDYNGVYYQYYQDNENYNEND